MPVEDGEWDERPPVAPAPPSAGPANLGSTSPDSGFEVPPYDGGVISPIHESHPETQIEMSGPTEPEDDSKTPLPEFDPKVRNDFEGLLYVGRLTDVFDWLGHRFQIRTLTVGEICEVGLLHRQYVGTLADVKAYQAAIVAACVMSVDDRPMPMPITNEVTDTGLLNRFNYVMRSWFPPTLDAVYERYLLLEERVEAVVKAMGKAPGWTESTLTSNDTFV